MEMLAHLFAIITPTPKSKYPHFKKKPAYRTLAKKKTLKTPVTFPMVVRTKGRAKSPLNRRTLTTLSKQE